MSVAPEFLPAFSTMLSIGLKGDCKKVISFGWTVSSLLVNSMEMFLVLSTKNIHLRSASGIDYILESGRQFWDPWQDDR